jgi:hypothetical protein
VGKIVTGERARERELCVKLDGQIAGEDGTYLPKHVAAAK